MHPHVSSISVSIRSAWLMLGVISTMSSAKRKWCTCRLSTFTLMSSYSNFRIAFSKMAVNILEWRNSGREVAVQLSRYLYLLSRNTLVVQGIYDRFRLN
ncbi:hypothetical protein RB195_023228 [Necator americanus]|uniref:Secreted protein n=1 Tax=Necator americanus TaxID=51031 RepID=A0ABR1EIC4_NECAM